MKDGFIKVSIVTPEITVADIENNAAAVLRAIESAEEAGASVIVLPELCLCGYTAGDVLVTDAVLCGTERALGKIVLRSVSAKSLIFVSMPVKKNAAVYDCVVAVACGKVLAVIPKTNVSPRESRWFKSAPGKNSTVKILNEEVPFGNKLVFCHEKIDAFTVFAQVGGDIMRPTELPGVGLIVGCGAFAESDGMREKISAVASSISVQNDCAYALAFSSPGESVTDELYAGGGLIVERGEVLDETLPFDAEWTASDIDVCALRTCATASGRGETSEEFQRIGFNTLVKNTVLIRKFDKTPFVPKGDDAMSRCELILDIQAHALASRMKRISAKTAVIGVSGGLDSCLALLSACRAFEILGKSKGQITAVSMPCFGTSERTRENARRLPALLGVNFREVDITHAVRQHFVDIGKDDDEADVTYENAQARERTQVLMDIANREGGIVVGTGDMSEIALGWATYNGDHMSMYGVNASITKTLVRELVRHEAERMGGEISSVLLDIVDTPVSPELKPLSDGKIVQCTEDIVGPYELHDFFLSCMLSRGYGAKKTLRVALAAFAGEYSFDEIKKWLKKFILRFFTQQFKRSCSPDGVRVGELSLSPRGGTVLPSEASAALWLAELEDEAE